MTATGPRPVAVIVVVVAGREATLGAIDGDERCDLALVDAILRLRLAAGRRGWSIRLAEVRPDLRELVELTGLGHLLDS